MHSSTKGAVAALAGGLPLLGGAGSPAFLLIVIERLLLAARRPTEDHS